jgi:hypothetical protein
LATVFRRITAAGYLAQLATGYISRYLGGDGAMYTDFHFNLPAGAGPRMDKVGAAAFARNPKAEASHHVIPYDALASQGRRDRFDVSLRQP